MNEPAKLGIPFDPLGEYEPHDTIYTLTVYIPEKVPGAFSQWWEKHQGVDYSKYYARPKRYENQDYKDQGDALSPRVQVFACSSQRQGEKV
jgi:hypothetical protein